MSDNEGIEETAGKETDVNEPPDRTNLMNENIIVENDENEVRNFVIHDWKNREINAAYSNLVAIIPCCMTITLSFER